MVNKATNKKPVRRRVHKGRIMGCAVILIGIIVLSALLLKGCSKEKPTVPVINVTETTTVTTTTPPAKNNLVVCIDPGHGGYDAGAVHREHEEKSENLELALKVKACLEKSDVTVVMTREDDVFISLDERCEIANNANADLFVSLHRNSADSGNGIEVWINKKNPIVDNVLATNILAELDLVGISKNRGVGTGFRDDPNGNYAVNSKTNMPSCLVEMGFVTNADDNKLFDEHIDAYAEAISKGIIKTAESHVKS